MSSPNSIPSLIIGTLILLCLLLVVATALAWKRFNMTAKLHPAFKTPKRKLLRKVEADSGSIWSDGSRTLIERVNTNRDLEKGNLIKACGVDFEMLPTQTSSKKGLLRSPSPYSVSMAGSIDSDETNELEEPQVS